MTSLFEAQQSFEFSNSKKLLISNHRFADLFKSLASKLLIQNFEQQRKSSEKTTRIKEFEFANEWLQFFDFKKDEGGRSSVEWSGRFGRPEDQGEPFWLAGWSRAMPGKLNQMAALQSLESNDRIPMGFWHARMILAESFCPFRTIFMENFPLISKPFEFKGTTQVHTGPHLVTGLQWRLLVLRQVQVVTGDFLHLSKLMSS